MHVFDGVEENGWEDDAAVGGFVLHHVSYVYHCRELRRGGNRMYLWTACPLFLPAEEVPIQQARQIGAVVPRYPLEARLAPPGEGTVAVVASLAVDAGVEPAVGALSGHLLVGVDWVGNGDALEAVEQRGRRGEDLRAHVATLEVLLVHGHEEATREAGVGDEGRAARGVLAQVAVDLVADDPVGEAGVEGREESQVVCFFTDAPLELVVGLVVNGRPRAHGLHLAALKVRNRHGAPDPRGGLGGDELAELGVVVSVVFGHVESFVALPDALPRLLPSKRGDLLGELVMMTGHAAIDFPVPKVFELLVIEHEMLHGEPLREVDTIDN